MEPEPRVGFDYCPSCELPTFSHETVVMVSGEYFHRHCFDGTLMVVKRADMKPSKYWN